MIEFANVRISSKGSLELVVVGGDCCTLFVCKRFIELLDLKNDPSVHLFKTPLFTIRTQVYSSKSALSFVMRQILSLKSYLSYCYNKFPF